MIIDTHVHIGKMLVFDMPPENVLYSMDKYGIDFSLVSNIECAENDHNGNPVPQNLQKSQNAVLEKTLEFARANPDKIGVLPWLKIRQERPDAEFIRMIADNRDIIYGLKLHPFHSITAPDDESLESVYKLAAEYIKNTKIEVAFVSTNSICQGAQVPILWNVIFNDYGF